MNRVGSQPLKKGGWAEEEFWFVPALDVGEGQIHAPEGPYKVCDGGTLSILVENDSDARAKNREGLQTAEANVCFSR